VLREHDGGRVVGRVKRASLVQRVLYEPLADDRPRLTEVDRHVVRSALADEVRMLDDDHGLGLARRWGWDG
jgi:hypothetical protein